MFWFLSLLLNFSVARSRLRSTRRSWRCCTSCTRPWRQTTPTSPSSDRWAVIGGQQVTWPQCSSLIGPGRVQARRGGEAAEQAQGADPRREASQESQVQADREGARQGRLPKYKNIFHILKYIFSGNGSTLKQGWKPPAPVTSTCCVWRRVTRVCTSTTWTTSRTCSTAWTTASTSPWPGLS